MQSPRKLEYLEHQLCIPESVADGGLLENVETPPAFRTVEAVLFIEESGFFTCGVLFCWAWKSKWRELPSAVEHSIAV